MEKSQLNTDKLRNYIFEKIKTMNKTNLTKESIEQIQQMTDRITSAIIENDDDDDDGDKKIHASNKIKSKKGYIPSDKVFVHRNSLFTDLMEITHIKSLYHMFVSIFILLFLNSLVSSLIDGRTIDIGVNLIMTGFAKFHTVIYIWICMQVYAIMFYGMFSIWVVCRSALNSKPTLRSLWDMFCICGLILYQIIYVLFPLSEVYQAKLPFVSGFVVLTEMSRFMMKTHAFARSVSPRVLNNRNITLAQIPEFSWYMYFLFVPTLVYRDVYPRTNGIRWNKVFRHLLEFIVALFYLSYLSEKFIVNLWSGYGPEMHIFSSMQIVSNLLNSIIPNFLTTLCGFYLLQHCFFNATAEILTFADRQFYLDWWNQTDYSGFYRTWNVVVHDWLHTYIYKDITMLTKNRSIGLFAVFVVSAIFHEIILAFSMGFFYPILLFMFGGFGFLIRNITKYINSSVGNTILLLTFAIGGGILYCVYSVEYFARINCPMIARNELYDFFIPRSWFCY